MRSLIACILVVFSVCVFCAETVPAPSSDNRHGLRVARKIDESTIRLTFGASFVPAPGKEAQSYRIVSPTDTAYQPGLRAAKLTHAKAVEVAPPQGWQHRIHETNTVTLTLPQPMKAEHRYWVQALGNKGLLVTGGRAAAWIAEMTDADEKEAVALNTLGLQNVELIAPNAIQITVGDGLDVKRIDKLPHNIKLVCEHDPDFKDGRAAVTVSRRTRGECFLLDVWPWGNLARHELFAVFDKPLKSGNTYTLDMNGFSFLTTGQSRRTLVVDDKVSINPALKVNQIGYVPDAPAKYGYLGLWMGTAGAFDYAAAAKKFEVRKSGDHSVVLSGDCKLRHKSGEANEGVYKEDLSMENVYELDFSALKDEGSYYVAIPGMGRSFTFRLAKDIYVEPFKIMMNGVLHQRCGIEMKAPYSDHWRPACHRNKTELTDWVHGPEQDNFKNLPQRVIDQKRYDLYGGHHDAGDYNPRSHLEIAESCFMAYEIRPNVFTDGQLRIPEAGNGIPDILDEGRWALDLWVRLQDADGGVRNGTESDGDPDMASPPDLDPRRDLAFAKDAVGSLRFAAVAAQAALIWDNLKKKDDAKEFLSRAVKAWEWAATHGGDKKPDLLALAAIQLYRASGEQKYLEAFHKHSVFTTLQNAQLEEHQKYDQRDASFYYALSKQPIDEAVKAKIVKAFKAMIDGWCTNAETYAYRYMKHPWVPNNWGTGCHPKWLLPVIQAQALQPNENHRKWILLGCDFALGCHPMNLVFTTGLGQRCIHRPFHEYSRYSPNNPIPGIQSEGPLKMSGGEKFTGNMNTWASSVLYPIGAWPTLQTYSDMEIIPIMHEGVVVDQMRSAFAYAFLLPEK